MTDTRALLCHTFFVPLLLHQSLPVKETRMKVWWFIRGGGVVGSGWKDGSLRPIRRRVSGWTDPYPSPSGPKDLWYLPPSKGVSLQLVTNVVRGVLEDPWPKVLFYDIVSQKVTHLQITPEVFYLPSVKTLHKRLHSPSPPVPMWSRCPTFPLPLTMEKIFKRSGMVKIIKKS